VAIGVSVIAGIAAVPYLPFAYARITDVARGGDAVHWLYLLVLPIVLVPTALFGAAFPVLVRIVTPHARNVARGMGVATAVNTAGSIAASLVVGFWWIPGIGSDATLYAILGLFSEAAPRSRARALAGVVPLVAVLSLSYGGIRLEDAIAGRQVKARDLSGYARDLRAHAGARLLSLEGKSSIVTVTGMPTARLLQTNGLPEAGFRFAPPYYPREAVFLGLVPYLAARTADRALVIGLGGGNTVTSLLHTRVSRIDVVELEQAVVEAAGVMHRGRDSPLRDRRVSLRVDDGRNDLLRRTLTGAPGYDLIVSQPSHPWRIGAASLFTEEFFHIARAALEEGGLFAAWLNGFRIDPEAVLAVVTSFERVFPGSLLVDIGAKGRLSFLLLGGRAPVDLDLETMARRLAEPGVAALAAGYGVRRLEDVLADVEGPSAIFAALEPEASNTDDNAFVETRAPRALSWRPLDYTAIESRLRPDDPVLPPWRGALDVAAVGRALLSASDDSTYVPKLRRLLAAHADGLDACDAGTLYAAALLREPARESEGLEQLRTLAQTHPRRPEPLRVLGTHLAIRRAQWRDAARAFAEAFARSGDSADAYDAGRALDHVDREAAWRWFERIAGSERDRYPRLAFYAARRALASGSEDDALGAAYLDLSGFLAGPKGRGFPGAHALASRLAWELGDEASARAHADADARQRRGRAAPLISRARSALAAGRLDEARAAVEEAGRLVPLDEAVIEMRTRIAMEHGTPAQVERSISLLRSWAPDVQQSIAAENRLRDLHGLPLSLEATPDEP
jgi:predicted membrane-bound spermidine synthase